MKKFLAASLMLAIGTLAPLAASATSYNGTTISPGSDGKTYTVNASAGDSVTLTGVGNTGGQIALVFGTPANGQIVINQSTSVPASASGPAPGSLITYYDVVLNGISNSSINSATWKFSVGNTILSNLGLAAANVRLYHFGSKWDALPTQVLSSDTSNTNFSAAVSSFSPFAVSGTTGLAATGSAYLLIGFVVLALFIAMGAAIKFNRQ